MNTSIKETINLMKSDCPVPMIECRTDDGKEFIAMLDTGSEITIFDPALDNYLKKEDSENADILLHSMHGEDSKQDASVFALDIKPIELNKESLPIHITGITSDLSYISDFLYQSYGWRNPMLAIIGSDTMRKLGWDINLENNTVSF